MNRKKNIISAFLLELATIFQGLILPHLFIANFGSNVNGLVSSATQFLSFISLLEGGLGAVVLSELYKPIGEGDTELVKHILFACQRFFRKLAAVFVVYTLLLAIVYPVFIAREFDFIYSASLIIILSLTTLAQYLFAITNKLLLQAEQKVFLVNIVSSVTIVINVIVAVVIVRFFPSIHVIKLCAGVVFFIQPIVFSRLVGKKYSLYRFGDRSYEDNALKNRWYGFSQHLAYFVTQNTDIAVLTVFSTLSNVSIYVVYTLGINAIKQIMIRCANSYHSALGKYYAQGDIQKLRIEFFNFEKVFWIICIILFSSCILLVSPFVYVYTYGVQDVSYDQPVFGLIMSLAIMICVIREPYRLLVLAAGKFKETNFGAIFEAIINIVISIVLVWRLGLIGVAIGTLVAAFYRFIYLLNYLKHHILCFSFRHYIKYFCILVIVIATNTLVFSIFPFSINGFVCFGIYGLITVLAETIITISLFYVLSLLEALCKRLFNNAM